MIIYDFFQDSRVIAGFSERSGGVSPMPENALNLSFTREPGGNRANVLANHRICAGQLGVEYDAICRVPQIHGKKIYRIGREDIGAGIVRPFPEAAGNGADGLITNVPGAVLSTTHADCVPVMLFAPDVCAVAAVHSGWRGTALRISQEAVDALKGEYNADPARLKAVIGPSISMNRFEVRQDVVDAFAGSFGSGPLRNRSLCLPPVPDSAGDPRWHLNVSGFVKKTLLDAGLSEANIFTDPSCTYSEPDRFFSHRRDGMKAGAMAAFISIRP